MRKHENKEVKKTIQCAVLTISDTRNKETDRGGQLVRECLKELSIEVTEEHYDIIKDGKEDIQSQVDEWLASDIDVIITTGGTGIAQRDVTIKAVKPLLNKEIERFGELFRYLSYTEDVETKALLSRALAGTVVSKLIFMLPGSTGAVKSAMTKLIIPELNHMVYELNK